MYYLSIFLLDVSSSLHNRELSGYKTKCYFSTHMANSAADAVWRGKMENILEFHKALSRNEGFLTPPQKQEFQNSSESSESEQEEPVKPVVRQITPPPRGRGRGRRGKRGRGTTTRVVGIRRSRRLAKTGSSSSSEEDERNPVQEMSEEEYEDNEEQITEIAKPMRKRKMVAHSPQISSASSEDSSEDEDTDRRPLKQPRYTIQQDTSQTSPLSSPRSDVSCDESPEPITQKSDKTVPQENVLLREKERSTSRHQEKSPMVSNEPHPTPLNIIKTPESTTTPVHQPAVEEMNYTIAHSTPEPTPTLEAATVLSKRQDCQREAGKERDQQVRMEEQHVQAPLVVQPTNQPSELTGTPNMPDKPVGMYSSQGWPVSHQFVQGGYPYNPKIHPMTAYHTPQGMMPSNYPYSVPYPWPHPPHSSQHPTPEQMRVGGFPHSVSPHPPQVHSSSQVVPTGSWNQQQQQPTTSKQVETKSPAFYEAKTNPLNQTQHIDHMQQQQQQQHGSIQQRIASSSPSMQYRYQTQQHVEGSNPFQYAGFDSRHASFASPAHMWQSPQVQHHSAAQLHPLMSHHFAQPGLWYAQQNPQHGQMGSVMTQSADSKTRKPGDNTASSKHHRSNMNTNNNNNYHKSSSSTVHDKMMGDSPGSNEL